MKKVAVIILLVLLAVAAGFYWKLHRPAPLAASLLPDSTLLLVRIPDFNQSRAELEKSNFAAFLREPEVQTFLAEPRDAWRTVLKRYGVTVNDSLLGHVVNALHGEVFVAVTRVGLFGNFQAGVVFGADVKGDLLKTKFGLSQAENNITEHHPDQPIESRRFLGVDYKAWHKTPQVTVCYGFFHSLFITTWGEDTMRDLITRFAGRKEDVTPALADNPAYAEFLAQMPAGNEFVAFLNMEPVTALLGPLLLMAPDSAASLQSLTRIRNTGLSLTFQGDTVEELRVTSYRAGTHEPAPVTKRETLAFTSPDTLVYAVGHTTLANGYDQLVQMLGNNTQFEAGTGLRDFDKQLRNNGINVSRDLLEKLGPETALVVDWHNGAAAPAAALVMQLRDPAATRATLDKVADALTAQFSAPGTELPWDELASRGQTLRTLRLGSSHLTPTYTTTDKFLIFTLSLDAAQELLAHVADAAPTVAQNATYQGSLAKVPANGTSYTYCDLKELYPHLASLTKLLTDRGGAEAFVNLRKLPRAETMQKYLSPFVSGSASTAERDITRSYSPFGSPFAIVAWAAGGYALSAMPDLSPSHESSTSSGMAAPRPPPGSQTAESHTPATP